MKLCAACTGHLIGGIHRRGWMRLVTTDPNKAASFARHWLAGTATRDRLCPYVVSVFELNAQAVKKGRIHPSANVCPICESAVRLAIPTDKLRTSWVDGVLEQLIRPLLASNGLIAGTAEKKRGRIITDFGETSINGGKPATLQ